jgi:GNAT superfamily N-acetyltransferase
MARPASEPLPVAFVAYHIVGGRHRFVDQIHVHKEHRRNGIASALLHAIATGPIELIAQHDNVSAIAFYVAIGMCTTRGEPAHPPKPQEIAMKTRSYRHTRNLLAPAAQKAARRVEMRDMQWHALSGEQKDELIRRVARDQHISPQQARLILTYPNIQFIGAYEHHRNAARTHATPTRATTTRAKTTRAKTTRAKTTRAKTTRAKTNTRKGSRKQRATDAQTTPKRRR